MDGTISKGSDLQSILVTYSSGLSDEFTLFEDGSIRLYNGNGSSSFGEFESVNQLRFTISWAHLVFYIDKSVTGTRK